MRKYNSKTKKTIIIILILFVVFIVIFSLFLKKSMEVAKTAYSIPTGSILFDSDKNMITTDSDSTMKIKWGGDYYLKYNGENINLGKHSVVYNSNNGDITLYGKFYNVQKNGDVKVIKDENKIKSSVASSFYKLADREYLIIDRTIEAVNSDLITSNYLIVNLDKSGNATLLNDKVSFKTITPTKLKTSAYVFDIANETLNFGKDDINLKKIIGSTNKYDEKTYNLNADSKNKDGKSDKSNSNGNSGSGSGDGTGTGNGSGTGNGTDGTGTGGNGSGSGSGNGNSSGTGGSNNGNGSGTGSSNGGSGNGSLTGGGTGISGNGTTQGSNSTYNNNYDSGISDSTVDKIVKATKNTSVIRVSPNIDSIGVDYVVYDPNNEYKSVYVEVENTVTSKVNIVYLSKTDTSIVIRNLVPNVYYNLTFKYSYNDKGKTRENTFDKFGTYTEIPSMTLTALKVVNNKVYYKISFDNNYTIVGGSINLLLNGQIVSTNSIPTKGNISEISGSDCYFDISGLNLSKKNGDILTIKLVSLSFNTYTIKPNLTYKFKY